MDWILVDIRNRTRQLTGKTSVNRLEQSTLDDFINSYYQDHLPNLLSPDELQALFTTNTSAGVGEYSLEYRIRVVYPPPFINDEKVNLSRDVGWFFEKYKDRYDQPQGLPETVLYFDRTFWLAPIPDNIYEFQIHALYRPDALILDTDKPIDTKWGEVIAVGAAVLLFERDGDYEAVQNMESYLQSQIQLIGRENILNWYGMRAVPLF